MPPRSLRLIGLTDGSSCVNFGHDHAETPSLVVLDRRCNLPSFGWSCGPCWVWSQSSSDHCDSWCGRRGNAQQACVKLTASNRAAPPVATSASDFHISEREFAGHTTRGSAFYDVLLV
jgi:hypothetical protein